MPSEDGSAGCNDGDAGVTVGPGAPGAFVVVAGAEDALGISEHLYV